jgi:hypothetical protein
MTREGKWFHVEGVSFPRSGHAYALALLKTYFGPEFVYEGNWHGPGVRTPGSHFQKNHDFDLDTPILQDRSYLVQIRDPFDCFYSWHQMTIPLDGIPDTIEVLREISNSKLEYWTKFVRKWVFSAIPNRLILNYRDLVNLPQASLEKMVRLFGEQPHPDRIAHALHTVRCIKRREPDFFLT